MGATNYGDTNATICIGTASGDSGTRYWLFCENWEMTDEYGQKISNLPAWQSYSDKTGKLKINISITNAYTITWTGAGAGWTTNTLAFNEFLNAMRNLHAAGDSPVYLSIQDCGNADLIDLGISPTDGSKLSYLKGYFTSIVSGLQGKTPIFKSMEFIWCVN